MIIGNSLEKLYSINSGFGATAATSNNASITRSVFFADTTVGLEADSGGFCFGECHRLAAA